MVDEVYEKIGIEELEEDMTPEERWAQHDATFERRRKSGAWPAKTCEQCTSRGCCRRAWHHIANCCNHCGLDERKIMPIESKTRKEET